MTSVSPLETVARNHGAVMATRHGRRVPAHFGSTAAEEAVCQTGVGMADRSDRETFELRGTPEALERALASLERGSASFITPDRAIVRCDVGELAEFEGVTAHERTASYAAIGLIGPRASELLNEVDL